MITDFTLREWYYITPDPFAHSIDNNIPYLNMVELLQHYGFDYPLTEEQEVEFKLRYL